MIQFSGKTDANGFTLLEVVIAFAILSLSAVVLFGGFSAALGTAERADRIGRTESAARSIMARLGADIPLRAGQTTGGFAGGSWVLGITPESETDDTPGRSSWALYHVTLDLESSGAGSSMRIETLRVGKREDAE